MDFEVTYTAEQQAFRREVRAWLEARVTPSMTRTPTSPEDGYARYQELRGLGRALGDRGWLFPRAPVQYGGGGLDVDHSIILEEEVDRFDLSLPPYYDSGGRLGAATVLVWGTEAQKQAFLPPIYTGRVRTWQLLTEPGAGSDLAGVTMPAIRDGDEYVLNGQKTFISNGIMSDLVIVVARTDPDAGHQGISLLVVERGTPGFERGRNLDKIGQKAQDTAELFFNDVRVPARNLLGEEGQGFVYLMQNLPQERLSIAVASAAAAEKMLSITKDYCKGRTAFGRPIGRFQHIRFELAEIQTEADVCRAYVDRCLQLHEAGELDAVQAAQAKWWTTELQKRTVDRCLQLFGGYGYMTEFPISRAYLDSRIQTIYGGTTEIQKEIIGRSLGL